MDPTYFDIDALLADNQKMACTFTQAIPEMGHLWGGGERDIAVNSKHALPLWMAFVAVWSDWVDFPVPPPFASRVRNALDAEARSVKLSGLVGAGGLWYAFGKVVCDMIDDEKAEKTLNMLNSAFRERLIEIIDQAQSLGGGTGGEGFREGLDGTERELFVLAQESARQTKRWYEESDAGRR